MPLLPPSCHFIITGWDPLLVLLSALTEHQQLHMMCIEWRPRITTSKIREVCHTRGQSSAENLVKRLLKPSHPTEDMRSGLDLEAAAVKEHCRVKEVNHYPCGFPIRPDAPRVCNKCFKKF